ncbi:MAG: DUF4293 domain-containing protein [Crocinitomicaceae bacterium]|jgi:hypothetical protein|nr:DUF4293 domain-containing protein [Crocinitomicaceae bacterium]
MIQRVQTIYLVLAFLCVALLLQFPLFSVTAVSEGEYAAEVSADFGAHGLIFTSQVNSAQDSLIQYTVFSSVADNPKTAEFPVYLLYITLALFTAAAILLYKKRKRQLLFARLSLVLHILVVIALYAFYHFGTAAIKKTLPETAELTITFGLEIGFYLMLASIPFLILAIRGIKSDENLVKSLDRLR